MWPPDNDLAKFSRLIEALRPWLGQIIIVGGRAHRLYRERHEAASADYEPLRTDDADVAIDPKAFKSSENVRDRLKAFGFDEAFSGDDQPPVTHYGLGDRDADFYAEFLTPLVGGERRRDGSPDVTERVGGVVAQKLRHLGVLLVHPWSVTVSRVNGFDLAEPAVLQIPNPASYMIQKLLIHDRRKPAERPKDVLYIHDTIELFGESVPALREIWHHSISPTLSATARRAVSNAADQVFGAVNDTIREAALIAAMRRLSPIRIQEVCSAGLDELLRSA